MDPKASLEFYRSRLLKSRAQYKMALETSIGDIRSDLRGIVPGNREVPLDAHLFNFIKDSIGAGIWVSRSYLNLLKSTVPTMRKTPEFIKDETHKYIIDRVSKKRKMLSALITNEQIFQTIFNELNYHHYDASYCTPIITPKIKTTIVLIPGVLNELYRTHAFERSAAHLNKLNGIKYITPKVHGRKGSISNANMLYKQLKAYIEKNPKEKLWLLAYSKGGVDSLYLLKKYKEFSENYIVGLSTIASPIMGSTHVNLPHIKLLQKINSFSSTKLYQLLDQDRHFLGPECPESVCKKKRTSWIRRNHKALPKKLFYSSLALQSHWYESNIWMMLTKLVFPSKSANDGVVDIDSAHYPSYFKSINMGTVRGHHLIGARSSFFNQEALLEAHLITLNYLGHLK